MYPGSNNIFQNQIYIHKINQPFILNIFAAKFLETFWKLFDTFFGINSLIIKKIHFFQKNCRK